MEKIVCLINGQRCWTIWESQTADIVGDALEAEKADAADNAQLAEEMGLSAAMKAAQMANDLVAMAIGMAMGKDPCLPPGTIGAITLGSPNVLIGGFPMPSWMNVAKGLMKLVKGLRPKKKATREKANLVNHILSNRSVSPCPEED